MNLSTNVVTISVGKHRASPTSVEDLHPSQEKNTVPHSIPCNTCIHSQQENSTPHFPQRLSPSTPLHPPPHPPLSLPPQNRHPIPPALTQVRVPQQLRPRAVLRAGRVQDEQGFVFDSGAAVVVFLRYDDLEGVAGGVVAAVEGAGLG